MVDGHGIDDLVTLVLDRERRLPVFVAGSDDKLDFGTWSSRMETWFRQIYGVGHGVVLTPDATEAFRTQMLPGAEAQPWAIRTYLRGVGDDDSATLRRHRFLGTKRLAEMRDGKVAELLGRVAREQANRRAASPEITAWERRFTRLSNAELVTTAPAPEVPLQLPSAVPARDADASSALSTQDIAQALGLELLDREALSIIRMQLAENAALRDRLRDANSRLSVVGDRFETYELHTQALEDENSAFEELIDDLNLDLQIAEREQIAADNEVRRLRGLLAAEGRADAAFDSPRVTIPETYESLLDAIESLEEQGVVFTGDADTALSLEDVDTLGKCVGSAWRACLALVDYVELKTAGDIDQDVHWYLEHNPTGRKFPPNSHAKGETSETMRRFGKERIFPVPSEVDSTGRRQMVAHFKLGRLARQDPRLYYFDDTPNTGKVYIGYIGRHLTTVQTANS